MGFRREIPLEEKEHINAQIEKFINGLDAIISKKSIEDLFGGTPKQEVDEETIEYPIDDTVEDDCYCGHCDTDVEEVDLNNMDIMEKLEAVLEQTLDKLLVEDIALENAQELLALGNAAHVILSITR